MATIHKEFIVRAPAEHVWDAIRDLGAVHSRLAQQFVVDTRLEGDTRLVTFSNGVAVHERIVTIDEQRRRLVYAVTGWQTTHHNASFRVVDKGEGLTRVVWVTDLLPDDLAGLVDGLMEQGTAAMKRTLEATAPDAAI